MLSGQKALIIGAGLAGITTAAHLAREGIEVTVLEKNDAPGGRCSQLIRDGHRFDTGPTLFLIPDIFAETYELLGERMEDHLDLRRIDPTYRFHFDDGRRISLTADMNEMRSQLEAIEPGSFAQLLQYLAEGQRHYQLTVKHLVDRNYYRMIDYFSLKNLLLMLRTKALKKHSDSVAGYFNHPHLREAFTFQDMYLGLSPYDAPATYSLLQYTEVADGVWYPIGGMYTIVESLVSIAQSRGARFIYNTPVKRIDIENGKAKGVLLGDGSRMSADLIIANADLPYVYRDLLPDKKAADRLERLKYTCSAIMFYWGVEQPYPQLDTHNLFVAGDFKTSLDQVFQDNSLPEEPNFYVHAPSRIDPSAAPPGQDSLMVLVPAGHLDNSGNQNWEALRTRARKSVLNRLSSIGLTDLENHLKFEVSYTPMSYLNRYNLSKGAAFGSINHNLRQVGYLRPKNRHSRYSNLYFAGGSTHPGNGLPLVLKSARLTTERILKEIGVSTAVENDEASQYYEALPTSS